MACGCRTSSTFTPMTPARRRAGTLRPRSILVTYRYERTSGRWPDQEGKLNTLTFDSFADALDMLAEWDRADNITRVITRAESTY